MTRSFYAKNNVPCCMTYGSNSSGDEDTILLGYNVVSVGKELPVFLRGFLPALKIYRHYIPKKLDLHANCCMGVCMITYDIIFTGKMSKVNTQCFWEAFCHHLPIYRHYIPEKLDLHANCCTGVCTITYDIIFTGKMTKVNTQETARK